jgi:hypothetical protein
MSNVGRNMIFVLAWITTTACSSSKDEQAGSDGTVGGAAGQVNTASGGAAANSSTKGSTVAGASAIGGKASTADGANTGAGQSTIGGSTAGGRKGVSGGPTAAGKAGTGGLNSVIGSPKAGSSGVAIAGASAAGARPALPSNAKAGSSGSTSAATSAGGVQNPSAGGAADAAGRGGGSSSTATGTFGGSAGSTLASSEPTAQDLLDKVTACGSSSTAIKGGFGLDGGSGSLSIYQCQSAVYWKADMDVDCDGIQTSPCDTDEQGQPQTSIVDDAPDGDVDPTKLPYFVIPLGDPETTWYQQFGIGLGQIGAVIYKGSVRYGIFADEAGGAFIGEASYAMCQLFLGKPTSSKDPCDPNQGGIDPAEVTYITFTGTANRATGSEIYSHDQHTAMGIAAAKAWLAQ